MDPISQGALGGALAQSVSNKQNIAKITLIGCLAGMAPDLDVLIQSTTDPILFLEYHRQFTHSLIFIPVGSLFVAIALYSFVKNTLSFKIVYLASILGYLTHGLLDACTSYGTLLFWPFSNERIAWNNVSVVDPIFTVPLVLFVVWAIRSKKKIYHRLAIGWAIVYLCIGFIQHERTLLTAKELAEARGHTPERLTLKPSFGNLILWKSIYQHKELYFVDAIRTASSSTWCSGESIEVLNLTKHLPSIELNSQQVKDIERFRWFSQDYLGYDQANQLVTDIRYSMIPSEIRPMWGQKINSEFSDKDQAIWWSNRGLNDNQLNIFKNMLTGSACPEHQNSDSFSVSRMRRPAPNSSTLLDNNQQNLGTLHHE